MFSVSKHVCCAANQIKFDGQNTESKYTIVDEIREQKQKLENRNRNRIWKIYTKTIDEHFHTQLDITSHQQKPHEIKQHVLDSNDRYKSKNTGKKNGIQR